MTDDTAYMFRQTPYKFRQRLLAMNQAPADLDYRRYYGYRSCLPCEERLPWEKYVLGSKRVSDCWRDYLSPSSQACFQAYTKSWWEHKDQEDLNKENKKKKKNKNKSKGKKPKEEEEKKKKKKKKRIAEGKTNLSLETPPLKKHKATAEQDVVNVFHKEKKIINSEAAVQDDQVVIFKRLKITKSEEAVQG
ncbi:hypothetical protein OROMI_029102 [Orobanche minor]